MSQTIKVVLGTAVLAVGGYMVYKYLKSQQKGVPQPIGDTTSNAAVVTSSTSVVPAIAKYFPLKRGSSGQKVVELQKAIIAARPSLLPKYGADGKFGPETQAAVVSLLGKSSVDSQDDINKILSMSGSANNNDRISLGQKLIQAFQVSPFMNKDFYATAKTQVERGTVQGGHYQVGKVQVLNKGDKLGLNAQATLTQNSLGFIIASYGGNYVSFSPYAFELK